MSEAELHLLRARLIGGMMNKARRGELQSRLPIGFVYDAAGHVTLDPDKQVQHTIRFYFETFRRTGSAIATVKVFREQGLTFPSRIGRGSNKGDIVWGPLEHARALWVLHNPRYAGAFFYGRSRQRKQGASVYKKLPRDEWIALLRDAHPGYLSWEEFENNQELLHDNSAAHGGDRRRSPAREGPALLQGMTICGICGLRMTVRYRQWKGKLLPIYVCQRDGIRRGRPLCQQMPGVTIDESIGNLVVESVSPMALKITLAVQEELETRTVEADKLRHKHVERAQYEVDVARRRFMRVDPDNRLVADSLESEWNAKLRNLSDAQEQYTRQHDSERALIDGEKRARILALANDVQRLWYDPATPDRERKRMLRLIIEDVTLIKAKDIVMHVRFRGGATRTLSIPKPLPAWKLRQIDSDVVSEIDKLIDEHTDAEIATILRERGVRTYLGTVPHRLMIRRIRIEYGLKSRFDRLRQTGMLTGDEMAKALAFRLQL